MSRPKWFRHRTGSEKKPNDEDLHQKAHPNHDTYVAKQRVESRRAKLRQQHPYNPHRIKWNCSQDEQDTATARLRENGPIADYQPTCKASCIGKSEDQDGRSSNCAGHDIYGTSDHDQDDADEDWKSEEMERETGQFGVP